MHVQSFCFAKQNLLTFWRGRCPPRSNFPPRFSWERGFRRRSFVRSQKRPLRRRGWEATTETLAPPIIKIQKQKQKSFKIILLSLRCESFVVEVSFDIDFKVKEITLQTWYGSQWLGKSRSLIITIIVMLLVKIQCMFLLLALLQELLILAL